MAAPGKRTVTDPDPVPPAEEATSFNDAGTPTTESGSETAAIAREAAAIYPDTNEGAPTPQEIAAEAYQFYMSRGAGEGSDLDDWLEAERRCQHRRSQR
jgi:hypothetical protein